MRARLSEGEYDGALTTAREEIQQAFAQADMDAWPDPATLLNAREELLKG
jgi:hypothetical protein